MNQFLASLSRRPDALRRAAVLPLALACAVVWTHAGASAWRAWAGQAAPALAEGSLTLTVAALVAAVCGSSLAVRSTGQRAAVAAAFASAGGFVFAGLHPGAWAAGVALVPACVGAVCVAAWLSAKLPASLEALGRTRRTWSTVWVVFALLALVQIARLSTYVSDPSSDWFTTTREAFFAKHQCLNAYLYGAELQMRGEPNVYEAAHYPGLTRDAQPQTRVLGMSPEDPYQYPPQFLLLPRMALMLSHDYAAIAGVWFGLNFTLCIGALLALARWISNRVGLLAGLFVPAAVASVPVLHNLQYGQFHFAAVALAVLAMMSFEQRRETLGGALLASAVLAKVFPAVLLVYLAAGRRFRALGWTALFAGAFTGASLAAFGADPFVAFFQYQLPRLRDGSAFAFEVAWPEVTDVIIAGNQGALGIARKLTAMGWEEVGATMAQVLPFAFALITLGLTVWTGGQREASRVSRAVHWLSLLGLASLGSAGAWADYVPVTGVWLACVLLAGVGRSAPWRALLWGAAALQWTQLGALPWGELLDARWMIPLSLLGAVSLFYLFIEGSSRTLRPANHASLTPVDATTACE